MKKAEKTRNFIVEQTASLFNTKGYAATSLSDITNLTGLTKGSIYGNFSNKDEVIIEVFNHNVLKIRKGIEAAVSKHSRPYDQLMAMVTFYREMWLKTIVDGGCPMLNAATEADDNLLFLKSAVKTSFEIWQSKIVEIIEQGTKDGSLRSPLKAAVYASTFIMLIEGGILLGRTLNQTEQMNIALDRIVKIIDEEIAI